MIKLNAKELRTSSPISHGAASIKKNPIFIILDNVLDTYNVGSIFRLADAVAAEKVYLCGETLTPPNHRIKKASINTWQWVQWEYCNSAIEAIEKARKSVILASEARPESDSGVSRLSRDPQNDELRVICVEQDERSIPYTEMKTEFPVAIVVGNETYGVSKEVLDMADQIVEIPMWGVNKSLNVMVSLGIVLYKVMEKIG